MMSARFYHTATLLPSGQILIAGGATPNALPINTAELFDPASGIFTSLPNMTEARYGHTATLLPSGKVLIAGGFTTNTAELFDPASGTFTALPNMTEARSVHTATLLPSGQVLIAGGYTKNTAELFDPASGIFTALPNTMTSARHFHTATLLPSGQVLIAGGFSGSAFTNTAELFDPASGTFISLPPMTSARYGHTATLLPSGKVLMTGGFSGNGVTNTAELFDPASGTFISLQPMTSVRYRHTATLLPSGKVLLAGGGNADSVTSATMVTNTAELFDPASGTFTSLFPNTMTSARYFHTATLLPSGKVLIAGGSNSVSSVNMVTNTAELFDTGLGFVDARRPVLSTVPNPLVQPASLVLTGTGFRGDSEGSAGSTQSSATNYPVLQLQRIDNEQVFFTPSDPVTNWSDTQFSSETLGAVTPLPAGHYRVTVYTSAIPSLQRIIRIISPPDLTLTKSHAGAFSRGQSGATYSLSASNVGASPTTGTVVVGDILPAGLAATAIAGGGWACDLGTLTCTRDDVLAAGSSYPPITLTVDVAGDAPAMVTNTATVSGGGDATEGNNTGTDSATVT